MRRPRDRPGSHGGDWGWLEQKSADRKIGHLRLVVEGLVPLGVLPRVLGGVKTVVVLSAATQSQNPPATFRRKRLSVREALTLPQRVSWHRRCLRRGACTMRRSQSRRWWRQRGGRCSSRKSQLPRRRRRSRRRAVSPNSSAIVSMDVVGPVADVAGPQTESSKLAGAVRVVKDFRGSYRSCLAGSIAGCGAGGARVTQC